VPLILPSSSQGTSLPLPIRFTEPVVDGHACELYQRIGVEVHLEFSSPEPHCRHPQRAPEAGTWASGGSLNRLLSSDRGRPQSAPTLCPGKVEPSGMTLGRNGDRYEDTSEYRRHQEAGEDPYPATEPWYPLARGLQPEFMTSMLNGYPYPVEAVIFWNTNPMYGQAGLHDQVREAMADPNRVPLIVSIDAFLNETSSYADYVLPDTILYEAWGAAGPWGGVPTKANSVRWPVVDAPIATTATGEPVGLESFLISVSERLQLPGFGDDAIPDQHGALHPLRTREDWFARVLANMAFDEEPVADADPDELAMTGVDRVLPRLRAVLRADEWPKVARILTRGGRFEPVESAYDGEGLTHRYEKPMQLYDERLGTSHNTLSGERFVGTATWLPPVLADGSTLAERYPRESWPLRAVRPSRPSWDRGPSALHASTTSSRAQASSSTVTMRARWGSEPGTGSGS
jgi:tetrathionate reductase subunit A